MTDPLVILEVDRALTREEFENIRRAAEPPSAPQVVVIETKQPLRPEELEDIRAMVLDDRVEDAQQYMLDRHRRLTYRYSDIFFVEGRSLLRRLFRR